MADYQSFGKNEREKKRAKQRKEKERRKLERKENKKEGGSLDDMLGYVDEFGNVVSTPPEPTEKEEIDVDDIILGIPKKEDTDEEDKFGNEGTVAFFDHSKGFGFILDNKTQQKYFVHVSGVLDEIQENDKVRFELEQGKKGMNAVRVKKI